MSDTKWAVVDAKCRICNHKQISVVPVIGENYDVLDDLECANCGNMTCQEDEPNEWEQKDD